MVSANVMLMGEQAHNATSRELVNTFLKKVQVRDHTYRILQEQQTPRLAGLSIPNGSLRVGSFENPTPGGLRDTDAETNSSSHNDHGDENLDP